MPMIEVKYDYVAEHLDDIADLCEHWKRNRGKGRMPSSIRSALLLSMKEVISLDAMDKKSFRDGALCSLADELERISKDMVESSHLRPQVNTVAFGLRSLSKDC